MITLCLLTTLQRQYVQFLRVVRWWRHLKMLKRAGRGHHPQGPNGTTSGGLAVICPACPQPGSNLPLGWETALRSTSWLYTLYLAMDANFRLKLHNRGVQNDPELGGGWGYFVNDPDYQAVMVTFGDQEEVRLTFTWSAHVCSSITQINTCDSGLHAVDHTNTRFSRNNLANGVGNIVCARHTFVCPTCAVDLAKGEKYVTLYAIMGPYSSRSIDSVAWTMPYSLLWRAALIHELCYHTILHASGRKILQRGSPTSPSTSNSIQHPLFSRRSSPSFTSMHMAGNARPLGP